MRNAFSLVALCATAVCLGVPLTISGTLLFHLDGARALLFSMLLFGGLGCGTIIGGRLADRYPAPLVLLGGCTGVTLASMALPLWQEVGWILASRFVLGGAVGLVFVAGARRASLHQQALFAQGLYGGALQLGAGLGVLLTPVLLSWLPAQGVLFCWALGSLVPVVLWGMQVSQGGHACSGPPGPQRLSAALGIPVIWKLGAIHTGTFGMGTALAGWIALYLSQRYHLPLVSAALFGSLYLLAGIILRPAGGLFLQWSERWMIMLMQLAAALVVLGVFLLSVAPTLPLALGATTLLALGMNLPYASVLTLAARCGASSGIGAASAQGAVVMLLCLGLICMPILIGVGMSMGQPFISSGLLFGGLAIASAWGVHPHHVLDHDNLLAGHTVR